MASTFGSNKPLLSTDHKIKKCRKFWCKKVKVLSLLNQIVRKLLFLHIPCFLCSSATLKSLLPDFPRLFRPKTPPCRVQNSSEPPPKRKTTRAGQALAHYNA